MSNVYMSLLTSYLHLLLTVMFLVFAYWVICLCCEPIRFYFPIYSIRCSFKSPVTFLNNSIVHHTHARTHTYITQKKKWFDWSLSMHLQASAIGVLYSISSSTTLSLEISKRNLFKFVIYELILGFIIAVIIRVETRNKGICSIYWWIILIYFRIFFKIRTMPWKH